MLSRPARDRRSRHGPARRRHLRGAVSRGGAGVQRRSQLLPFVRRAQLQRDLWGPPVLRSARVRCWTGRRLSRPMRCHDDAAGSVDGPVTQARSPAAAPSWCSRSSGLRAKSSQVPLSAAPQRALTISSTVPGLGGTGSPTRRVQSVLRPSLRSISGRSEVSMWFALSARRMDERRATTARSEPVAPANPPSHVAWRNRTIEPTSAIPATTTP